MSVAGVINGLTLGGTTAIVDGVTSTHVVSTEAVIATYSIQGGTFKGGDILQIQSAFLRQSTTTTFTVRIYWNNTPDLTTPVLLAQLSSGVSVEYLPIMRTIGIVSATTSLVYATNVGLSSTDFGDVVGNELTQAIETITSIDWNIDGYFVISMSGTTGIKYYFTVII
jgi:hypothetical protein